MALTPPLNELVKKLRTQTEAGKIAWEETANEQAFLAPVGKFIVTLAKEEDVYKPDTFTIRVSDSADRTLDVGEEVGYDGALPVLHEIARRRALQVDARLQELLSSLD